MGKEGIHGQHQRVIVESYSLKGVSKVAGHTAADQELTVVPTVGLDDELQKCLSLHVRATACDSIPSWGLPCKLQVTLREVRKQLVALLGLPGSEASYLLVDGFHVSEEGPWAVACR
jgi:hypothetical protein